MPKRCGDLAQFRFKVEAPVIGKVASIKVRRKKDDNLTAHHVETLTKAEDKKIRWPDLQDPAGSEFFGGRKTDLKGLNKLSYQDKFKEQEFKLELSVAAKKVKSSGFLKINAYPDVPDDPKSIGIPMPTEMWDEQQIPNPVTGIPTTTRVQTWSDPTGTAYRVGQNCGNFHLSVKDGVVLVTVKIDPQCARGRSRARVFAAVKKAAETFWNSRSDGYRQWIYHRKECKRKDLCDCKLVLSLKDKKYTQAGCCKVPVHVVIEDGADNPVTIHYLSPAEKRQLKTQGVVSGLRANTLNLYYPENNPHTYAHEVGHMMGFPDQYWYGVIAGGSLGPTGMPAAGAAFPIDDSSIMGQNMAQAKLLHISATWFSTWIESNVDKMKVIPA